MTYPLCIDGRRHGPPEDCGGIGGFYRFLEAIDDSADEEHEEMLEWIGGGFDPEAFSVDAVNNRLQQKFRVRTPKTVSKRKKAKSKSALDAAADQDRLARLFYAQAGVPQPRKRIRPDDTVALKLSARERELILNHTFADDNLTRHLRVVPKPGQALICRFNLDDWEDLAGYVAAEANHATNKKLQKELSELHRRVGEILESYTDQED